MGIPDHLTCLLRNLYAGQEATVRTGHGTTDWFQVGKGVCQGCICHPAYLTYMQSQFSSVAHHVQLFVTPWTAACQASLLNNSWSCLKLMSINSVMPSNHLILSVVAFSFCPQSLPASGSLQMSQFFASGGQSIGVSASASVLPMNIQD